jgi:hypothetical protein
VTAAAWLTVTGLSAEHHVRAAQRASDALRAHTQEFEFTAAQADLRVLQREARAAERRTHDPVWWTAAHVPFLDRPVTVVRELAEVGRDVATDVLPPALQAAEQLNPAKLRPAPGRIDLAVVKAARAPASAARQASADAYRRVRELPRHSHVGRLDRVRADVERSLRDADGQLNDALLATELVPPLLGDDGPRTYFVGFQNNAEARGTGGLPGSFAILRAEHGALRLLQVGSEADMPLVDKGVDVALPPEFDARYRDFGSRRIFVNSNVTAHFPYAAQIWQAMWKHKTGQVVDGAFALDPVAQSYLLSASGPVTAPGVRVPLSADSFVGYVERQIYADYPDVPKRKKVLAAIAGASFDRVLHAGSGSSRGLVSGLRRAAREGRLLMWSARPAEQQLLEGTEVSGVVPAQPGPYAQVVLNNAAGSKLDYYVRTDVAYSATAGCTGRTRGSKVVVTVTNNAPAHGLPPYVTIRADNASHPVVGAERLLVSVYAPVGADLVGVKLDGAASGAANDVERSHPVFTVDVDIPPGGHRVIELDLSEPVVHGARPVVRGPAAVLPGRLQVDVPVCA